MYCINLSGLPGRTLGRSAVSGVECFRLRATSQSTNECSAAVRGQVTEFGSATRPPGQTVCVLPFLGFMATPSREFRLLMLLLAVYML
ncbi:unnamed protein product [Protopolystoma xenopodis]|uniref:Uncharacterized protein n=1 Tax=Protopolystoma xenopodis TaxID=117903 RepID=A0A448WU58_9PLAT|nr:unnamed protein product [Protopolystoma xenopodis]